MVGETMVVEIRYFASLAQSAGCSHESVELKRGDDIGVLWRALERKHPGLAEIGFRPLVACDRVYAGWDRRLDGVREVAFLPPLSGG
jgi:molybdopterin converting factor small subunit